METTTRRTPDAQSTTIPLTEAVRALPIVCLQTANFDLTIGDLVKGKNTVIDFWTTKCTRCPAALDQLDAWAACQNDTDHPHNVHVVSLCCDKLDGAREILERDSTPRWNHMRHCFLDHADKERAKALLGFAQVPFYVAFNADGEMVHCGNKIDLATVFSCAFQDDNEDKENIAPILQKQACLPTSPACVKEAFHSGVESPTNVFMIDDLDF